MVSFYVDNGGPMGTIVCQSLLQGTSIKERTICGYDKMRGISYMQHVKKERIIGVVHFTHVPPIGCISLIS